MSETSASVYAVIAEIKAKLANPDAGELTVQLCTLAMQGLMPMVREREASGRDGR